MKFELVRQMVNVEMDRPVVRDWRLMDTPQASMNRITEAYP